MEIFHNSPLKVIFLSSVSFGSLISMAIMVSAINHPQSITSLAATEVINTGSLEPTLSPSQIDSNLKVASLKNMLPVTGNGFDINFEYKSSKFLVTLYPDYTQSGTNLTNWLIQNQFSSLTQDYFNVKISNITPTPIPGNWTMVDERNSAVSYAGAWTEETQTGAYLDTQKYTQTASASASYTFSGTGVRSYTKYSANHGVFNIYLDGIFQTSIDAYAASPRWQVLVFEKTGLSNSSHVLKVVNAATSGRPFMVVDVFASMTPKLTCHFEGCSTCASHPGYYYSYNPSCSVSCSLGCDNLWPKWPDDYVSTSACVQACPSATPAPSPTPAMTNSCRNFYYCNISDHSCRLTASTYEGVSQKVCPGLASTCTQNLANYLSGQSTGICYYYQNDCLNACH
jgi:hypothetical protein